MYCNFFGLRCRPFDEIPDPNMFCATARHEEVLAAMEYDANHGAGVTLVLGEAGTGKTMLLRALQRRLADSHRLALVSCPISREFDILRAVGRQFGISRDSSAKGSSRVLARIKKTLRTGDDGRRRSVLMVDQAENLGETAVRRLAALTELGGDQDTHLQVLIACQPRFRAVLERPELDSLRQRAFDVRSVEPLDEHDTARYVAKRLELAGHTATPIFEPDAISKIHHVARGIPRLVNRLCDAALLSAYGMGSRTVSLQIAREVASRALASSSAGGGTPFSQPEMLMEVQTERPVYLECAGMDEGAREGPYAWQPSVAVGEDAEFAESTVGGSREEGTAPPGGSERREGARVHAGRVAVETTADDDAWRHSGGGGSGPGRGADRGPVDRRESAQTDMTSELALAQRLERAIRRAERLEDVRTRWGADVEQLEMRLDDRLAGGESMIHAANLAVQRLEKAAQLADQRSGSVLDEWEQRLASFERRFEEALGKAGPVLGRIEDLDRACRRAKEIEERLTTFGERLVENGETAQEKISTLMQGLTNGESVLTHLRDVSAQVEDVVARGENVCRRHAAFVQDVETRCGAATAQAQSTLQQIQAETIEVEGRLHDAGRQGDAINAAAERLTERTGALEGRIETCSGEIDAHTRTLTERVSACSAVVTEVTAQQEAISRGVAELTRASAEARNAAAEARRQLETVVDQNQSLSVSLQDNLKRMDGAQRRASGLTETVERVEAKIDEIELGAAQTTGQLEDLLKSTQWRMDDLSTRGREQTSDLALAVKRAEGCMAGVRESIGQVESAHHTVANCLINIGSACERVDAARQDVSRVSAALEELRQTGGQCDALEQRFAAMLKEADGLDALLRRVGEARQFAREVETLIAQLEQARRSAEQMVQKGQTHVALLTEQWHTHVEEARQRGEETRARLDDVANQARDDLNALQQLAPTLDQARQLGEALSAETGQAGRKLEALGSHVAAASDVIRNLAAATQQAHTIVTRIDAAAGTLDDAEQRVARVARLTEQWHSQVDAAQPAAARLDELVKSAAALATSLASREHSLKVCARQEEHSLTVVAQQLERRFEDQREQALAQLGDQVSAARGVGEEIDGATRRAAEAIVRAKTLTSQLAEAAERLEGSGFRVQGSGQAPSLASLAEVLVERIGDAERLGQRLDVARDAARPVGERLEAAMTSAGRMMADAAELCNAAQTRAERLEAVHRTGQPLLQQLTGVVAEARTTAATLDTSNSQVQESLTALHDERRKAGAAGQRLRRVVAVLRHAQSVHQALTRSTEEAQDRVRRVDGAVAALRDEHQAADFVASSLRGSVASAAAATQQADFVASSLRGFVASASDLANQLAELRERGESLVQDLDQRSDVGASLVGRADDVLHRVVEREDALQAGERMLREFMAAAAALAEKLQKLQGTVEGVEQDVTRMAAEPARIVEDARRQAVQLDAVCKAVRKVFAGLSKSGLDANQKTAEFAAVSRETQERVAALLAQTRESTASLREWVEEAVRAQTRLARTLEKTPAVAQTHPIPTPGRVQGSGLRVQGVLPGHDRQEVFPAEPTIVDSRLLTAELTPGMLTPGTRSAGVEHVAEAPARPLTRADEIDALLRDVRRNTPGGVLTA